MPEITRFNGIVIKMFTRGEHNPPHFHAVYNDYNGLVEISTLKMIEGDLPSKQLNDVIEWAKQHLDELNEMWNTKNVKKIEG